MNKNNLIWIGAGVIIVVVVAIAYFTTKNNTAKNSGLSNAVTQPVGTKTDFGTVTQAGIVAAPGASAIASTGVVMAPVGKVAQNNVAPSAPSAPQQSNAITNVATIPAAAVKLTVSAANGFSPNAFTVLAGQPITISVTSADNFVHVLAFQDPSLSAIAIGVGPNETRAITFNVPTKSGEYKFYSNVPNQTNEVGVMTVK
jgi:plastocyanin